MSQIKLTNEQIKIVGGVGAGVVALIFGVLFWKSSRSKEEPEYVEDSDEINEVEERPSETSTVDLNNRDDDDGEGWQTGTGGKRSRKRRKNKSKKYRSKSKRRTKK
jgi:hypothetical protein